MDNNNKKVAKLQEPVLISDALSHPKFPRELLNTVRSIVDDRLKIFKKEGTDRGFKRHPFDYLVDNGYILNYSGITTIGPDSINIDFPKFHSAFMEILNKKSNLSKANRELITQLYQFSLEKVANIIRLEKSQAERDAQKIKPKKASTKARVKKEKPLKSEE